MIAHPVKVLSERTLQGGGSAGLSSHHTPAPSSPLITQGYTTGHTYTPCLPHHSRGLYHPVPAPTTLDLGAYLRTEKKGKGYQISWLRLLLTYCYLTVWKLDTVQSVVSKLVKSCRNCFVKK